MGINHRKNGLPDPTLTPTERARRSMTPSERAELAELAEPSKPRGTMGATLPSFTVGAVMAHASRLRESDSGSLARAIVALQDERDFLRREIVNLSREIARLHKTTGR